MNSQLESLCRLQETDLHIRALDREILSLPEDIERLRHELTEEEDRWGAIKREVEGLEKKRREKERILSDSEAKLDKYNLQLLSIKTNKEYTAMLHEMDIIKEGISSLEEEILLLLDEIEEKENFLNKNKEKIEKSRKLFDEKKNKIEARLESLKKEKEAYILKRNEIVEKIDHNLIKEYQRISKARNGIAVTQVKEGSCTGCNMALMPQLFQEIMTVEDEIFRCPNCHRIVFYIENKV